MADPLGREIEPNDPGVIPAPDVDLSEPIYPSPESTPVVRGFDYQDDDETDDTDPEEYYDEYSEILERLERIEQTVNGMKDGVNTIGSMMNQIAEAFDQIMQKVNEGGIGALLSGFMGGKKNG